MKERIIIEVGDAYVGGRRLHLVLGKTHEEWEETWGDSECWDIKFEELLDGTMEINEDIWYWLIDGRCYETTEETTNLKITKQ